MHTTLAHDWRVRSNIVTALRSNRNIRLDLQVHRGPLDCIGEALINVTNVHESTKTMGAEMPSHRSRLRPDADATVAGRRERKKGNVKVSVSMRDPTYNP